MDKYIDPKTAIQTAKLVSFSSAFLSAGYTLSFSQAVVPALYDHSPLFSTPAFNRIWKSNAALVPFFHTLSLSASTYLAYVLPEKRQSWTIAAVVMALTLPWTGLVMGPGVKRLQQIEENKQATLKSEQSLEHRQLMTRWVRQNYFAVLFSFASAAVGVLAAIE